MNVELEGQGQTNTNCIWRNQCRFLILNCCIFLVSPGLFLQELTCKVVYKIRNVIGISKKREYFTHIKDYKGYKILSDFWCTMLDGSVGRASGFRPFRSRVWGDLSVRRI